jgi:hypothetical protein
VRGSLTQNVKQRIFLKREDHFDRLRGFTPHRQQELQE